MSRKILWAALALNRIVDDRWTLADIDTQVWVDAADESTVIIVSDKVSAWRDKSGNDMHLLQNTAGVRPAYSGGGIVFSSDFLKVPLDAFPTVGYALIAVMTSSSTGTASCGLINIDSDPQDDPSIRIGIGDTIANYMNGAYTAHPNASCTALGIISVGNAAGITSTVHRNGTQIATATVAGGLTPIAIFNVGFYGRIPGYRNGTLYEMAVIQNDTDTRQKAEGYLAHKWDALLGVTTLVDALPSGHPYKSAPPLNG